MALHLPPHHPRLQLLVSFLTLVFMKFSLLAAWIFLRPCFSVFSHTYGGGGERKGKLIMGCLGFSPPSWSCAPWGRVTSVQMRLWGGGRKRRRQTGCEVFYKEGGGRRPAGEGDARQTSTFPNAGGGPDISCGKIQQNAIKDKFFIVLSCRQLGKIPSPQHK